MDAIRLSPPRRLTLPVVNRWGAGEMSVLDFGDPERPVDLVFVHANGFNAMTYRTLLAPLSGTLRIWAPDPECVSIQPLGASERCRSGMNSASRSPTRRISNGSGAISSLSVSPLRRAPTCSSVSPGKRCPMRS